tara:strand:+ start:100 stop:675 length:576 start_codon:yes stop_codon:yes gene_type:complete
MLNVEEVVAIVTLVGFIFSGIVCIWKVFKTTRIFIKDHEQLQEAVQVIRSEVTPNGGSSLKDLVNKLKITCDRIEVRQKLLDQRSKAALHYQKKALFEIDSSGGLTWCNEAFKEIAELNDGECRGSDWIAVIDEDERENFVKELNSCLKMCRKLDIETVAVNGSTIHFMGYPYRIGKGLHEGFLIHLNKEN